MKHILTRKTFARLSVALFLLAAYELAYSFCTMPPPPNLSASAPVQIPHMDPPTLPSVMGIVDSGKGFMQRDFAAVPGATTMGGSCWGWWYQDTAAVWRPYKICGLDKYLIGGAKQAVVDAMASTAPLQALQAAARSYFVPVTDWSETNDYNCLHYDMQLAMQATKPADPPPAPGWQTPKTAVQLYLVVGTSRQIIKDAAGNNVTVPPFTKLDCNLKMMTYTPIPALTYTYCALLGGTADKVAQRE